MSRVSVLSDSLWRLVCKCAMASSNCPWRKRALARLFCAVAHEGRMLAAFSKCEIASSFSPLSQRKVPKLLWATSLSGVTASVWVQSDSVFCQYNVWIHASQVKAAIMIPATAHKTSRRYRQEVDISAMLQVINKYKPICGK